MPNVQPIVQLKPTMTSEEMLTYPIISLDGVAFVQASDMNPATAHPRKWSVVGMGFVGGLMEPFTDREMLEKASMSTNIAVLPNLEGNTIIVLAGCEALVNKYA